MIKFWNRLKKKSKIYEYIEVVFTALLLAMLIRTFVIQAFKIPSSSMVPTLKVGDHLFVCKFIYGVKIPFTDFRFFDWYKPKRGDIIVFRYPGSPKRDYIKRVIGLPGEQIMIKNKQVYINGKPLKEEYKVHYSISSIPETLSHRDNFGPHTIPPDTYFVMGDNRDNSKDSRFWGDLPLSLIKGKALFIYWPPHRIGLIR
jgi:signal peptidase I